MTTMQTLIVYSWLLPAAGFIVLPLVWSLFGMMYRAFERSRLSDIKGFIMINDMQTSNTERPEKRSLSRIWLEDGKACVDTKCGCFKAQVSNISNQGICLQSIPGKMFLESDPMRIVFRTRNKDYSLIARTKWKKMIENGYVVGAEVTWIPAEWKILIEGLNDSLQPGFA